MEASEEAKDNSTAPARKAKRKAKYAEETTPKTKRAKRTALGGATTSGNGKASATSTSLSKLPDDVLIKIVSVLPKAQWASLEGVNYQFQRATFGAWRSVRKIRLDEDFLFNHSRDEENVTVALECLLEKLLLRSPNTNEITGFSFVGNLTPEQRDQSFRLLGQFKWLERISFANWKAHKDDVAGFVRQCCSLGNIKELDISGLARRELLTYECSFELQGLWCCHAAVKALHVANARLTTLSLADTYIRPDTLVPLVNSSDRLERLDICVRSACKPDSYKQLFHAVAVLASKSLSVLKISGDFMHHLRSEVVHLIEECGRYGRLKKLSLHDWHAVDSLIDVIADNLTHLTSLEMSVHGTASLINLMTKLTNLQKLKLDTGVSLNSTVVAALATNLVELKSLDLSMSFSPENLALLTNLKKLRINAEYVTNAALKAWSNGFGSNLESLSLVGHARKGYLGGLSSFIKKASRLRLLSLGDARVKDRHLRIIASSCPLLREFYVHRGWASVRKYTWPHTFTAEGVQAIIDGCRHLKWLKMEPPREVWDTTQLNVGKYRKINFFERDMETPFGGDE